MAERMKVPSSRPKVAFICNSLPPYRVYLLRRFVCEIPEIQIHSVFTHETGGSPWQFDPPRELNPISFGPGESASRQSSVRNSPHEWRKGGRIIRWIEQQQIDAVVMMGYNDAARLRILHWCKRHHVPCYLRADSNIHWDRGSAPKMAVKRWLLPRILSRYTGVMPCGQSGRAYFEKYGVAPDRMFLCPVVPDFEQIMKMAGDQIDRIKARFDLVEDRRRIVFSGRLVPTKRLDLLIAAFLAVVAQRPEWDLIIIGDGPLREELEAEIPAGMTDRVTWTGFLDTQEDVSALYRACDVLVLASDWENWALVVLEAVAAGLAVVSSSVVGAAADLVRQGENGFVFRAGDLADLIRSLLEVTDATNIDRMKSSSVRVLKDWRLSADPVTGLKAALASCGVL